MLAVVVVRVLFGVGVVVVGGQLRMRLQYRNNIKIGYVWYCWSRQLIYLDDLLFFECYLICSEGIRIILFHSFCHSFSFNLLTRCSHRTKVLFLHVVIVAQMRYHYNLISQHFIYSLQSMIYMFHITTSAKCKLHIQSVPKFINADIHISIPTFLCQENANKNRVIRHFKGFRLIFVGNWKLHKMFSGWHFNLGHPVYADDF